MRPFLLIISLETIGQAVGVTTVGRPAGIGSRCGRAKARTKDDIHHPLIGRIAIFECNFLGQDLDPLDRLGWQVTHFLETRDARAVEQQHGGSIAARAAGLRRDRGEQFDDAGRAGGANVAGCQRIFGGDFTDDRSARSLSGDHDVLPVLLFLPRCDGQPSAPTRRQGPALESCLARRSQRSRQWRSCSTGAGRS